MAAAPRGPAASTHSFVSANGPSILLGRLALPRNIGFVGLMRVIAILRVVVRIARIV